LKGWKLLQDDTKPMQLICGDMKDASDVACKQTDKVYSSVNREIYKMKCELTEHSARQDLCIRTRKMYKMSSDIFETIAHK
ncbi:hypothetical protein L9F63_025762, partial [Diploptera punctata]